MSQYKPSESPYFSFTNRCLDLMILISIITGTIIWFNLTFTVNWNMVYRASLTWIIAVTILELFVPEHGQFALTSPRTKIQCATCPHHTSRTTVDQCMIYGGLYPCIFIRRFYLFDYCYTRSIEK